MSLAKGEKASEDSSVGGYIDTYDGESMFVTYDDWHFRGDGHQVEIPPYCVIWPKSFKYVPEEE